ncbi:putative RNA-directed DNA polymerase from transposon X-element [Acropora cervicornis]|uniref:RNA-directed DNA polymerase from transposon X-element n=1 Tax=Acropora cervicornis TaxID=6130 RepID=A0AAD9UZP5_ACRCE|nr:putative RNA-directed DNA polymerase from transposon X-element [Acropora cervicornis]
MASSRFCAAKTAEEVVNLVRNAVPKSTQYKNKWAYGIFEEWQRQRLVKVPIVEVAEQKPSEDINPMNTSDKRFMILRSALDAEMKDATRAGVALQNKKAEKLPVTGRRKQAVEINKLNGILLSMCKKAGFKPKSSHCLRVMCASALFNAGIEEKLIRDRTGHRLNALFKYEKASEMKSTAVSDILAPKCRPTSDVCLSKEVSRKSSKASGPDGIGNRLLKEYAHFLAKPITHILNSSFAEQELPLPWKFADVIPLPTLKPNTNVSKHIRPISLTPSLSKVAEDFVVLMYVGPTILKVIDPNQFCAIPKLSTAQALITMVHEWARATDGTGAVILVDKILSLSIPLGVVRWVCDFLLNRHQRVKLAKDCCLEWSQVPSGVPQGTILGPWLFLLMINNLRPSNAKCWKFVDDTTLGEVVKREGHSRMQYAVEEVEKGSRENKLVLNGDKCKEMVIDFSKSKQPFDSIGLGSLELERVGFAKVLGLTLSENLTWNCHVEKIITKGNKRLFFFIQLKRAGIPVDDIVTFYCTCFRLVLEYCSPVYHHGLPKYLSHDIEGVQKWALKIISPSMSYTDNLTCFNLQSLKACRDDHCRRLFSTVLPPVNNSHYNLRTKRRFQRFVSKTNRSNNTFLPAMCNNF